jgi:hypothetical protein
MTNYNDYEAMLEKLDDGFFPGAVIYHTPCADGLVAAWCAWEKSLGTGTIVKLIGYKWGYDLPDTGIANRILFVDVTPPMEYVASLLRCGADVWIADHHASAQSVLDKMPDICRTARESGRFMVWINQSMSGAMMSWRLFNETQRPPDVVRFTQDRDLWKHELPGTDEMAYAIHTACARGIEGIKKLNETPFYETVREWRSVCAYVEAKVSRYAEVAELVVAPLGVDGDGVTVWAANTTEWRSEVGHLLAKREPHIALIWWRQDGMIHCSLRSDGPNAPDVAVLARNMGGGGHKQAAGFKWNGALDELLKPVSES